MQMEKGDRLFFSNIVTSDDVIEPAYAESFTWAAGRFCLSSDQSRKLLEIRNDEAMVPDFAGGEYVAPMKAAGSAKEYASKKRSPLTVIEWRAGRRAKREARI